MMLLKVGMVSVRKRRVGVRAAFAALAAASMTASVLLMVSVPAQARQGSGNMLPDGDPALTKTMTLKDLGGGSWRRMRVPSTGDGKDDGGGGFLGLLGAMMGGGSGMGGALGGMMGSMLSGVATAGPDVYYTQGKTISLGSETYLVAYQPQMPPVNMLALMKMGDAEKMPIPKPLTPESPLSLSLLNLRVVGSLLDIRAVDVDAEIAASKDMVKMIEDLEKEEAKKKSDLFGDNEEDAGMAMSDAPDRNLRMLMMGFHLYLDDHDMQFPDMSSATSVRAALTPYLDDNTAFMEPKTQTAYKANASLSKKKLDDVAKYSDFMVVFYEDKPASDGTRGVALLNGKITRVGEAEWQKMKKASKIQP